MKVTHSAIRGQPFLFLSSAASQTKLPYPGHHGGLGYSFVLVRAVVAEIEQLDSEIELVKRSGSIDYSCFQRCRLL